MGTCLQSSTNISLKSRADALKALKFFNKIFLLFSCDAGASWPDGEKLLNYLKEVDHVGVTGEIRFDKEGFRTDVQLDLIEKMRGRFRKTATWTPEMGVNYTMTTEEIGTHLIEKLANRTLRVTTTTVSRSHSSTTFKFSWNIVFCLLQPIFVFNRVACLFVNLMGHHY